MISFSYAAISLLILFDSRHRLAVSSGVGNESMYSAVLKARDYKYEDKRSVRLCTRKTGCFEIMADEGMVVLKIEEGEVTLF